MSRSLLIVALTGAFLTAVIAEVLRLRLPSVGQAFDRMVGTLLRPRERTHWSGATWLVLSFLLVVVLFPRAVAVAAMWAVAVGDSAAAIAGRWLGGASVSGSGKTIVGASACALTTAIGAFAVAQLSVVVSLLGGLVAALAEWPSSAVDDNLRIGICVGIGILLSDMAFS